MMRVVRAALAVSLWATASCSNSVLSTTQSIAPIERAPQGFASWADGLPPYQLEPGDKIKVQFLLTPEMNEESVVGPDGFIGLRAAGRVQAAGKTMTGLQADVAQAASGLLIKPVVTVALTENPGSLVFVGGAVNRAGAYTLTGRRGSFEAVQLAGGFGTEARMDEVVLIRRNAQDRPMLRTVDLRSLLEGSDRHPDVPLVAGDIVFVPRNRISEVDLWIDQYINRFLPFGRTFSYTINKGGVSY